MVSSSLPFVCRQTIGQMNPKQPIFNPSVIARRNLLWMVKTANRDVHLRCVRPGQERQRSSTIRAEGTQSPRPSKRAGLTAREPKFVLPKRGPRYKRRAAAPAAINAVAVRDVIRVSRYVVTHRAAQATTGDDVRLHVSPTQASCLSGCSVSRSIKMSRGSAPLLGPTMPRLSNSSMMRAARP